MVAVFLRVTAVTFGTFYIVLSLFLLKEIRFLLLSSLVNLCYKFACYQILF